MDQDLLDILKEIASSLALLTKPKPNIPPDKELWDIPAICAYTGLKDSSVRKNMLCKPTFPKPKAIGGTNRWKAIDVMNWVDRQTSSTPVRKYTRKTHESNATVAH